MVTISTFFYILWSALEFISYACFLLKFSIKYYSCIHFNIVTYLCYLLYFYISTYLSGKLRCCCDPFRNLHSLELNQLYKKELNFNIVLISSCRCFKRNYNCQCLQKIMDLTNHSSSLSQCVSEKFGHFVLRI